MNKAILMSSIVALATTGCADEGNGRGASGGGGLGSVGMNTDGADAGGDDDDDDGGATSGDDDDDDGGGPAFDLPPADDGDPLGEDEGCKRVDFLFVVDNSVSMEDNQAALVGAFPGFMQAIQNTLAADSDYHILVADTDAWGRCNTINGWNGNDPGSDTCNNYIKNTPFVECDRERGAGVIHPAGQSASNMHCMTQNGTRYPLPHRPSSQVKPTCRGPSRAWPPSAWPGIPRSARWTRWSRRCSRRSTDPAAATTASCGTTPCS